MKSRLLDPYAPECPLISPVSRQKKPFSLTFLHVNYSFPGVPEEEGRRRMAKSGQKSVNIPIASSGRGLREELEKIATKRAVSVSKIVSQIYAFAVESQGIFPTEIEKPRSKPGKHISTDVPDQVAKKLSDWAHDVGRSRAYHCCFLLECVIGDERLRKRILG